MIRVVDVILRGDQREAVPMYAFGGQGLRALHATTREPGGRWHRAATYVVRHNGVNGAATYTLNRTHPGQCSVSMTDIAPDADGVFRARPATNEGA